MTTSQAISQPTEQHTEQPTNQEVKRELIDRKGIMTILGVSRSTFLKIEKLDKTFPEPIIISSGIKKFYSVHKVNQWIKDRLRAGASND